MPEHDMDYAQASPSSLLLDKDGYLARLEDWSEPVAMQLARQDGIELSDEHWEILRLMRDFHARRGLSPVNRVLVKLVAKELGENKGSSLHLLKLFPGSPARVASRIAGLPRPANCI